MLLTLGCMKGTAILLAILAGASTALAEPRVVVESVNDASPHAEPDRARHEQALKKTLDRAIATQLADKRGHVDATIVQLTVEPSETTIVVSAQVRLAISDDTGKIVSMLSAGAKVETPARMARARAATVARMREDAIVAATESLCGKLKQSLASAPAPRPAVRAWRVASVAK